MQFEWDPEKAAANLSKHGVNFQEATTCFGDRLSVVVADPLHSDDEDRFVLVGESAARRLLVVVHTERGNRIRIMSARQATRFERRWYES